MLEARTEERGMAARDAKPSIFPFTISVFGFFHEIRVDEKRRLQGFLGDVCILVCEPVLC
jgi:hypothetical protein